MGKILLSFCLIKKSHQFTGFHPFPGKTGFSIITGSFRNGLLSLLSAGISYGLAGPAYEYI